MYQDCQEFGPKATGCEYVCSSGGKVTQDGNSSRWLDLPVFQYGLESIFHQAVQVHLEELEC